MPKGKRRRATDVESLIQKWQAQKNKLQETLYRLSEEARSAEAKIEQLDKCIKDLQSDLGGSLVIPSLDKAETSIQEEILPSSKNSPFEIVTLPMTEFEKTLKKILLVREKVKVTDVPKVMMERGFTFTAKNPYISAYTQIRNSSYFELAKEGNRSYVILTVEQKTSNSQKVENRDG